MRSWSFAKGHGTQNDFVLIQDSESMLDIGPADVQAICNRRTGVGGDGLLRAVKARHIDGWEGDGDLWFMDYRNADGSLAEMCGNGLRVFARYLTDEGLVASRTIPVATRSGLLEATVLQDGRIRCSMGPVRVSPPSVTVNTGTDDSYLATPVDVGNPHAVCFIDDLQRLRLQDAPTWDPLEAFPSGVNVEFVRRVGDRHIAMRVYERGVGETPSCGTGTVAAAAASALRDQSEPRAGASVTYRVDVTGGTVEVELAVDQAYLTGPAVIVAHGELSLLDEP